MRTATAALVVCCASHAGVFAAAIAWSAPSRLGAAVAAFVLLAVVTRGWRMSGCGTDASPAQVVDAEGATPR